MSKRHKYSLLFLDLHEEWLIFVEKALDASKHENSVETEYRFSVQTSQGIGGFRDRIGDATQFNLVFVSSRILELNRQFFHELDISRRSACIIMFPGTVPGKEKREYFRNGFGDVICKPYNRDALIETIEDEIQHLENVEGTAHKSAERDYQDQVRQLINILSGAS